MKTSCFFAHPSQLLTLIQILEQYAGTKPFLELSIAAVFEFYADSHPSVAAPIRTLAIPFSIFFLFL
jgi:hypothetical protein